MKIVTINWESLKGSDYVDLECEQCHKVFRALKKRVRSSLNGNKSFPLKFCSRQCTVNSCGKSNKTKTCNMCGKNKKREEFNKMTGKLNKPEWDCRDSFCTLCRAEYQTQRRRNIKAKAVEYFGGKCADCKIESKDFCIYDFHHLDPAKKDFNISHQSKSFDTILPELKKCVMICSNCHRIRHSKMSAK